jgi:hypothetical protein
MTIQDAILRLERAGDDSSKTTQKLIDATIEVANVIAETLDRAGLAPESGYICIRVRFPLRPDQPVSDGDSGGAEYWFAPSAKWNLPEGKRVHGSLYDCSPTNMYAKCLNDPNVDYVWPNQNGSGVNRKVALQFAEDVNRGLIGLISEWLENRSAKNNVATEILKAVAK